MARKGNRVEAIGYGSATNVGEGTDSEARQRKAIEGYARSAGYDRRMVLQGCTGRGCGYGAPWLCCLVGPHRNGVRTIIVESPDRFARDLAEQLAGHDHLKRLGVTLIPATAPNFFTEDTPTAVLVRQVLGAIARSTRPRRSPS
jgi:DNA invertase Pin-like site-specific DNA recombinase